jgi:MarR family transcriptional regulator, lower aerobic nicotinate degradation pathway regulator
MGSHASSRQLPRNVAGAGEPASIRSVLDALRRIVRDLRLSAREAERGAGISGAQLFVLQALSVRSASSLNELADRTLTDQSSVSVVVRRLADRKLIVRKPSSHDARRLELSLTPAGQRMLARCPEPTQARLLDALRRMESSELDALTLGLGALVRGMGIESAEPRMFFEETPASGEPTGRNSGPWSRDDS